MEEFRQALHPRFTQPDVTEAGKAVMHLPGRELFSLEPEARLLLAHTDEWTRIEAALTLGRRWRLSSFLDEIDRYWQYETDDLERAKFLTGWASYWQRSSDEGVLWRLYRVLTSDTARSCEKSDAYAHIGYVSGLRSPDPFFNWEGKISSQRLLTDSLEAEMAALKKVIPWDLLNDMLPASVTDPDCEQPPIGPPTAAGQAHKSSQLKLADQTEPGERINRWGIYKGFNKTGPNIAGWEPPRCPTCNHPLQPWIDWQTNTPTIGYCHHHGLHITHSTANPDPNQHERTNALIHQNHTVVPHPTPIEFKQLWHWHEQIGTNFNLVEQINQTRLGLNRTNPNDQLTEAILWTLIWNSSEYWPQLVEAFIEFTYHHKPQHNNKTIWLGHENDTATLLENMYNRVLLDALNTVYNNNHTTAKTELKQRLGMYIPLDDYLIEKNTRPEDTEFALKALEARSRIKLPQFQ